MGKREKALRREYKRLFGKIFGKGDRFKVTVVVERSDDGLWWAQALPVGPEGSAGDHDVEGAVSFAFGEARWRADKFIKRMRKKGLSE